MCSHTEHLYWLPSLQALSALALYFVKATVLVTCKAPIPIDGYKLQKSDLIVDYINLTC